MRYAFVCVLVVLSVFGCSREFPKETQDLLAAIKQIPFAPGFDSFIFDDEDTPTSFSFRLEYPTGTEGLLAFYKNHFEGEGWTDIFTDEDRPEGYLSYEKGNKSVNVSLVEITDPIRLIVSYDEYPHSRDEFETLLETSITHEAKELVSSIVSAYKSLETYVDTGQHERISRGELLSKSKFSTHYVRGGDFLFEYSDRLTNVFDSYGAIEKSRGTVRGITSYSGKETFDSIGTAIGAYYGTSSGTSGNVPELLFDEVSKTLFRLVDLKKLGLETLEGGTVCHKLQGQSFTGSTNTIWISKEDLLLRKLEEKEDDRNYTITTYQPRANVPIPPEKLKFQPPKETQ